MSAEPKKLDMSAEVEVSKEGEAGEPSKVPKRPIHKRLLDHWQLGFKLLELLISLICIILIYAPADHTGLANKHLHHVMIMYTAFAGNIVTNGVLIAGRYLLKDNLGYRTSFAFSTVGAVLFLATGILLSADRSGFTKDYFFHPSWHLLHMMTACILLAFVNTVVFAVDAALTFKKQADF